VAGILAVGAVVITLDGPRSPSIAVASSPVRLEWFNNDQVALTIHRDPAEVSDHYWRAATYDQIDLRGWSASATVSIDRPAGTRILEGNADDASLEGLRNVTFTVIPGTFAESTIVSPATPIEVNEATRVSIVGADGYFVKLDRANRSGSYTVSALVPVPGDLPGQLNRAALLQAGASYPREVRTLYTSLSVGAWGPNLERLKEQILAVAKTRAPIDVAQALEAELRSPAYQYTTDMRDVDCGTMSTAECFATVKRGFCQWYAPTMAVVLRHLGIPARIVQGFLPGSRDTSAATEVIRNYNAHAWVEVYFPGYGWITFDPTGGNLPGQAPPAPSGPP
jgi:transglutaminase-like putative cysteine protease